jgi:hypothetical protein
MLGRDVEIGLGDAGRDGAGSDADRPQIGVARKLASVMRLLPTQISCFASPRSFRAKSPAHRDSTVQ